MSLTKRQLEKVEINRPSWNYLYEENKKLKRQVEELKKGDK